MGKLAKHLGLCMHGIVLKRCVCISFYILRIISRYVTVRGIDNSRPIVFIIVAIFFCFAVSLLAR